MSYLKNLDTESFQPECSACGSYDEDDGSIEMSFIATGKVEKDLTNDSTRSVGVFFLVLLTCSMLGLQIIWTILMTCGTPYLLSLGLSKSLTALVWISGPLSGTIIQPIVGAHSDLSQSRWGKRKPYMVGGAIITILSLLALAWTEDLVEFLAQLVKAYPQSNAVKTATICVAVAWVVALNIAIQPLQSGIRAFIIDNCPTSQQTAASAWASGFTGIGSLLGNGLGMSSLPSTFSRGSNAKFKYLCIIASIILAVLLSISCLFIRERMEKSNLHPQNSKHSKITGLFPQLYRQLNYVPPRIWKVFQIQFFAWMAWFPLLFYSTTYISELYTKPILDAREYSLPETNSLQEYAQSIGSAASLSFAIVALLFNIIAPFFVQPVMKDAFHEYSSTHSEKPRGYRVMIRKISLRQAWMLSQVLFAIYMLCTIFIKNYLSGMFVIACAGVSWAFTLWAPYALIAAEISEMESDVEETGEVELDPRFKLQAGTIMGFHNIAISVPQIFSAIFCSGIFRIFQFMDVDDGIGWMLRCTTIPSLVAAYLIHISKD